MENILRHVSQKPFSLLLLSMEEMSPKINLQNMPWRIKIKHSRKKHVFESIIQFIWIVKAYYLLVEKSIEKMTLQKLLGLSSLPFFQQFKVQIYYLEMLRYKITEFQIIDIDILSQILTFFSSTAIQNSLNKQ